MEHLNIMVVAGNTMVSLGNAAILHSKGDMLTRQQFFFRTIIAGLD